LGDYDQAVTFIRQALSLAPDTGDYHYGLGWVYLLKGDAASAMPHMEIAADLGNPDARKYLMKTSPPDK
jgi:tetratricopeptide (TPR) repeat protein